MAKNIVLCLDGTGNELKAKGNTNVVRLYEILTLSDPDRQVAFYDPGLGTFGAKGAVTPIARRFTKLLGLAAGYGMRANLADAYTYLMQTYTPGDRIFIFGFSRGAYTARALAGMLHLVGLIRPGAENLVPYAIKVYARSVRNWTDDNWKQTHNSPEPSPSRWTVGIPSRSTSSASGTQLRRLASCAGTYDGPTRARSPM